MLPFAQKARVRTLIISSVVLVLCFAVYYAVKITRDYDSQPILPRETEVARQDAKIKITANTDLIQKIIYLKCNDEEVFRTKPADNLIGLNITQMQKVYPGWTISKFDTTEVEMALKVDSLCREHANNMFISIKDGYVTVFSGKPGPKAIVREVTKIPVSKLTQQDLEELRRGMIVHTREELLRTLEGMQSR